MALKAVLFDMDGVIVDTEPLHKKAYFLMFNKVGITVSDALYESYTGQSTLDICKDLVDRFRLTVSPEDLVAHKRAFFKEIFFNDNDLQLIDGVLDLIKDYHKNDVTLILASSASMFTINSVFDRFNLNSYFKTKLSGADLKASKPHPEIFMNAAKASGFNDKECIVIEDSTNGIKASYDAGIYCVAFKSVNSKNQEYTLANKVVSDYTELVYEKIKDIV